MQVSKWIVAYFCYDLLLDMPWPSSVKPCCELQKAPLSPMHLFYSLSARLFCARKTDTRNYPSLLLQVGGFKKNNGCR